MRKVFKIFLPVLLAGLCIFLWVDSNFTVRRLPLIPFGDTALGFKSDGGWLSWNEFWFWDKGEPRSDGRLSVPYWALVSLGMVFSSGAAPSSSIGRGTRFRWGDWTAARAAITPCPSRCSRDAAIRSSTYYEPSATPS